MAIRNFNNDRFSPNGNAARIAKQIEEMFEYSSEHVKESVLSKNPPPANILNKDQLKNAKPYGKGDNMPTEPKTGTFYSWPIQENDNLRIYKRGPGSFRVIPCAETADGKEADIKKLGMLEDNRVNYIYFKNRTKKQLQSAAGIKEEKPLMKRTISIDERLNLVEKKTDRITEMLETIMREMDVEKLIPEPVLDTTQMPAPKKDMKTVLDDMFEGAVKGQEQVKGSITQQLDEMLAQAKEDTEKAEARVEESKESKLKDISAEKPEPKKKSLWRRFWG